MRLPVIIASDFTGLVEYFIALIVWCIGLICSITAIALARSQKLEKGRSGPFAFMAIVSSMIILFLVAIVSSHYGRVDYIPLIAGVLPGVTGILCLAFDRPRK